MPTDQVRAVDEFKDAGLGDQRLVRRLTEVAGTMARRPDASFPEMFVTEAELEGFYRLVRNEKVSHEGILEPHIRATIGRAQSQQRVVVAHDTTTFRFGGLADREGLSRGKGKGERAKQEFHAHFSFVVSGDQRRAPLGVSAMHCWARSESTASSKRKELGYARTRELPSEQDRWVAGVESSARRLGDDLEAIHVMDSEADDYQLFSNLAAADRRFVVRLCYDRRLDTEASGAKPGQKTKELVSLQPTAAFREVTVSRRVASGGTPKRREVGRQERVAQLAVSAKEEVVFRRPVPSPKSLPTTLTVNIVQVREINPPEDVTPVEWLLITTESVSSTEAMLCVVDYYRARWRVEEFFKAIKTGCAYEKRLLQSSKTLLNALALFVPIAWHLLHLRSLSREPDSPPASVALTKTQLLVLHRAGPVRLPKEPTVRDALLAIARLGGHLRSNGEPGWQVLARGYVELLGLVRGYELAIGAAKM